LEGGEKMKKILLAVLFSVFLLSAMTVPALSQDEWTVGLSVGDWFKYETALVEYEADEGVPFPPNPIATWLVPFNETDWFTHTVTDVSGTTITWENVLHWKNGTETNATVVENIASSMYHYAIGADMGVGDEIAPSNPVLTACVIDETVDIEYEGTTRETNYARTNWTDGSGYFQHWWDKATGIQVKVIDNSSAVTAQGNATWLAVAELVDTNLWECAQPQEWIVGLSVGDWFKFKGTLVLWEGNASFPPIGMEFLQTWNESDWIEWTVTDIEGFNVTCEITTHWKNGTETTDTMTEDITSSAEIHIIGANLTEGTELRPETTSFGQPFGRRYLNASIMREYNSGPRETNVVIYDWDLLGNVYHIKALFDKATGMHVYFQISTTDAQAFGGGGTYSYNGTFDLIETNIEGWTVIPEFPTGTAMLLIFVAVTVGISILQKRPKRKRW
jgi:hypothetical protein